MSLAIVHSRAQLGIAAPQVSIEVHLSNGLPSLTIVGLPETAVRESKDRVRSALLNSHFEFPARRITVNLAPADLPKHGGRFDLPIALGILAASEQIPANSLQHVEFIGELALSGELRKIDGALTTALACRDQQRALFVPIANAQEATLAKGTQVYAAQHLLEICAHLNNNGPLTPAEHHQRESQNVESSPIPDMSDVIGQHHAKRALEIAAAGGHNLLLSGPPGTGKSMLASRLPGILPELSEQTAMESCAVYSVAGLGPRENLYQPPFRNPHHTASAIAMVGGSSSPKPGEISLAHGGILFLDELPEFPRRVLEVLREPMETGQIMISRVKSQVAFPTRFQLIAAMNPCPCGYLHSPKCQCSPDQIRRYRAKISGPLLDRIDLRVEVPTIPTETLLNKKEASETSSIISQRVMSARRLQVNQRQGINAHMGATDIAKWCSLGQSEQRFLEQATTKMAISGRGIHRILKVARTIADLAGSQNIQLTHLSEALGFRLFKDT